VIVKKPGNGFISPGRWDKPEVDEGSGSRERSLHLMNPVL